MKAFSFLTILMFVITADAANNEKEKAIRDELMKLKGKWKQVSSEVGGKMSNLPPQLLVMATIDGDKWIVESLSGKTEMEIIIDPTQSPKVIDRVRKLPDGKRKKDVVEKCIYKLENDTLIICSKYTPRPGDTIVDSNERPVEFKTIGGGSIVIYKRFNN